MRVFFLTSLLVTSALLAQGKDPAKEPKAPQGKEPAAAAAKGAVDFEKQILPILEKSCVECHSMKAAEGGGRQRRPKGGVNLEGKDQILASRKGKFIVAKKSGESELYLAISKPADDKDRMPPQKKGEPLPKEQQELIKKWIDEGASFGKWVGKKAEEKPAADKDGDKPKGKEPPKPGDKPKSGG